MACHSIDRRSLYNWSGAYSDSAVRTLVCFFCARKFPRHEEDATHDITLISSGVKAKIPTKLSTFQNLTCRQTKQFFGLEEYMERYGACDNGVPNLHEHRDAFDAWQCTIPFDEEDVTVIACPEDVSSATTC